jgi:O-antigen ligase
MTPKSSTEGAEELSERDAHAPSGTVWGRLNGATFVTLFFAILLVAPIPLGANRDWAWSPIAVILGLLAVWQALGVGFDEGQYVRAAEWRPLALVVLCFLVVVAMGILQISPAVPASWTADLYRRAAEALGHPIAAVISVNADASRAILIKIAACGAVFAMARTTCRSPARAKLLLVIFLVSATLVTTYGLVMQATNGSCYTFGYSKRPDLAPPGRQYTCALSGTFINSNSYAAFAGMVLVVALGLVLARDRAGKPRDLADAGGLAAWLTGARAVYLAVSLLLFGGLLLSESRAGFGATVLGCILLSALLLRGRWPSRPAIAWVMVGAILVAAVLALVTGSAFFSKMGKLSEEDVVSRFRVWQVVIAAIRQAPWLGWGLGSFPDLYSLLQPPDLQFPNDKAHSTPLEWVMEIGMPGALGVFAMIAIPLGVCLRGCWRRRTDRYLPAVAFAGALVPMLHSSIDFSLQMPAIGLMVAALLGMGWAQAFRRYE